MKPLINRPLLIEQLKRYWLIGAGFLLFYVLAGIIPVFANHIDYNMARSMVGLLHMDHAVPIIAIALAPFCAAMALYPYHFSTSAAAAFYSFPITKRQLFWTNTLAGLILMFSPLLVFCLLLLIPVIYPGADTVLEAQGWVTHIFFSSVVFPQEPAPGAVINTVPVVAGFFARMVVGIIFYFSVFQIAISVSGSRLISVLFSGTLPFIPVGVHLMFELIGTVYVFGYDSAGAGFRNTISFTNPVMWGIAIGGESNLLPYFLVYIAITAVLLFLAYLCSHTRKQERTGDSVVFTAFSNVCVFLLSMSGMIIMGGFALGVLQSRIAMYFGFAAGFAIAFIIAEMIAEKTFIIGSKIKGLIPYGAVMAGLYVIMLIITSFGMSSYVNHVPQLNEVAGVSLSHRARWGAIDDLRSDAFIRSPEGIAQALELHRIILDNREYLRDVRWQSVRSDVRTNTIPIIYQLLDGTTIHRSYMVSSDFEAVSGIGEFMHSRYMVIAETPAFRHPYLIERIYVQLWYEDEMDNWQQRHVIRSYTITDPDDIISLVAAVQEDAVLDAERRWERILAVQEWVSPDFGIDFQPQVPREFWWMWMPTLRGDLAENTLAWLEEWQTR